MIDYLTKLNIKPDESAEQPCSSIISSARSSIIWENNTMKITKLTNLLLQIHHDFIRREPWEDEIEVEMSIDEEGNDFHAFATEDFNGDDVLRFSLRRYRKNNSLVISLYPHQYDEFGDSTTGGRYLNIDEDEKVARTLEKKHKAEIKKMKNDLKNQGE